MLAADMARAHDLQQEPSRRLRDRNIAILAHRPRILLEPNHQLICLGRDLAEQPTALRARRGRDHNLDPRHASALQRVTLRCHNGDLHVVGLDPGDDAGNVCSCEL